MATYQFSALSDGQAISFNPTADVLNFDQSAIAAADIRVSASGTSTRIDVIAGPNAGKDITLLNTTPFQLATSNVSFVDGSRLLFGDNSTATGDDNGNTLTGGTGRDLIFAFGGSDTINVGTANHGNDFVDGGSGYDTLNFNGYVTTGLVVDFAAGTATGSGGTVTFANIERFAGGSGDDVINGNAANQNIGAVAGNDTIWGSGGNDTLFSGTGTDTFVFRETGTANADLMGDFASGTDKILLDATVMTALGASGNFAAGDARFWAAAGATGGHDADDRVVYNTTTRQLFYDADGNGSGAAQLIATLQSGATLAATDIAVEGGSTGQVINGTPGNDALAGGAGNDTINGLSGDDTIDGAQGSDLLNGGDGNDSLVGGRSDDDGEQALVGGEDTLIGGAGDDTLNGVANDWHWSTIDTLDGGLGNDIFEVDFLDVAVDAGGIDHVIAYDTDWTLGAGFENLTIKNDRTEGGFYANGNELDNVIFGGNNWWGSTVIDGADGNDTLVGGASSDLFMFGAGSGAIGNDHVHGGDGRDDRIAFLGARSAVVVDFRDGTATGGGNGGSGSVVFAGIEGAHGSQFNDLLIGNDGVTHSDQWGTWVAGPDLFGSSGNDTLLGGAAADFIDGEGDDDEVRGGGGDDIIRSTMGFDVLFGDAGNDTFRLFGSREGLYIDGGTGVDQVTYEGAGTAIAVNLAAGTLTGGGPAGDGGATILNVENISATPHSDRLTGDEKANLLIGNEGNDTLDGGAGNDTLHGGSQFGGSEGADVFLFTAAPGAASADLIDQFISGEDKIRLDASVMSELGASGNFSVGDARFYAAAGAAGGHDADDRVIYNSTTRQLLYDADGNGPGAAQLIATLWHPDTFVVATDIAVDNGGPPNPPTGSVLHGTEGNDSIVGTAENDTIFGHGGDDTLKGAAGDDWIDSGSGGPNLSLLQGDGGDDTLVGGTDGEFLDGGAGNDQLFGGDGSDALLGGADDDFLSGGAGQDSFDIYEFQTPGIRSYGNDTIDGGADLDMMFVDQIGPLSVDLGAGTLSGGVPGSARISGVEYFFVWEADVFNDQLVGDSANNYLAAGGGNDVVNGAAGDDWIDGGTGNDTVTGGAGHDNFRFQEAPGVANADRITDFASNVDTIFLDGHMHRGVGAWGPFAFNDARFYAAPGATSGHDADDRVVYDTSSGNLWFDGDGNGSAAAQLIATLQPGAALAATDFMVENPIQPFVYQGGPENNDVLGDELGDSLSGGGGNDTLRGVAGDDWLNGEDGDDSLLGAEGADTLIGGAGNDVLDGGDGVDRLDGGLGNDTYVVTAGDVLVSDPGGVDTVVTASSWNISSGTIDNITMTGTLNVSVEGNNLANTIIGNDAPNYINARAGSDTISGNGGNDTFNMSMGGTTSFGNDSIDGGAGVDTVEFATNAKSGLVADLAAGTVTGGETGGGGSSTILNIERFIAGDFNDIISGSGVANYLDARAGNDTVSGGAGADTLIGGTGNDRLAGGTGIDSMTGGAGLDSFVFGEAPGSANADRITDFVSASDKVLLDDAFHSSIGALGNFAAGDARFWAAAGATSGHDANDRVIYNTSTGSLYYDADGSGAGAAQLIATFTGNPAIAATDISVI